MSEDGHLNARDLELAHNTEEALEAHRNRNNGKVITRFPPEPNGYLHIGHCKSMHMNFHLAFEKMNIPEERRATVFRLDDTNPEAESKEYIDSITEDVAWMGWEPFRTTYASDYFQELYELAVKLIESGKAYVCHQTADEIKASREIARELIANPSLDLNPNSPWRDRTVEENLKLFEDMRMGKFAANEATLRMKIDMTSPNPNMWDPVAYRIKYLPHPHAGDGWCIYPTYDFTHCINDALEDIDYSICTLEFETRRESYYWLLDALDLFKPNVYEFSRLNITYTVLSKRRLLKLVQSNYVRGWDDPRMPTIKGLRRRGYTSETLNGFCNDVGVTRNNNTVDIAVLFNWARSTLDELSPRIMGVVDPLPVTITNFDAISNNGTEPVLTSEIPMFPLNPEKGSHTLELTPEIFIDASDFREDDDASFFGLSVGKTVFIKYMGKITCESVDRDETGAVTRLHCSIKTTARIEAEESKETEKPRGALTWVPTSAVPCELRLYDHLFTVPEPDSNWEAQLNPDSEIVKPHAFLDPSVLAYELTAGEHFQMERWGYFVVDPDTDAASSRIVMNRTVPLRDPQNKTKSRKVEQDAHLAELEARKLIPAEEYFLTMTDLYSAFDDTGVPTHDAAGEPLSKGRIKALRKEWKKQDKLFKKNNA